LKKAIQLRSYFRKQANCMLPEKLNFNLLLIYFLN
jgi:hypothetical protein